MSDPKRRPVHPGAVLREDVLPAMGWAPLDLAQALDMPLLYVVDVLKEKEPITEAMAKMLAVKIVGSKADFWLRLQKAHDDFKETP